MQSILKLGLILSLLLTLSFLVDSFSLQSETTTPSRYQCPPHPDNPACKQSHDACAVECHDGQTSTIHLGQIRFEANCDTTTNEWSDRCQSATCGSDFEIKNGYWTPSPPLDNTFGCHSVARDSLKHCKCNPKDPDDKDVKAVGDPDFDADNVLVACRPVHANVDSEFVLLVKGRCQAICNTEIPEELKKEGFNEKTLLGALKSHRDQFNVEITDADGVCESGYELETFTKENKTGIYCDDDAEWITNASCEKPKKYLIN